MENTTLEEQLDYDVSNQFSSQKIKRVAPEMFRKHKWQTEILNELFTDVNLKITCELRNKAVRLTGLKWTKSTNGSSTSELHFARTRSRNRH